MWQALGRLQVDDNRFSTSLTELKQSTLHNLILATGGAFLLYCFTAPLGKPQLIIPIVFTIGPFVILTCALSLWLVSRHLLAAQVIWHLGLAGDILISLAITRRPEMAFFLALLPFMAVVTAGWPAGLLAEGLVMALIGWLAGGHSFLPLPAGYPQAITVGGAFTGLLGLAGVYPLFTVTRWSLYYSDQANARLEEARDTQLELGQVQEDLIHANKELARLSDRLKAMHQVAEEARRTKEEFVANVSHELRTPLNMIIGFSEIITQSPGVYGGDLPPALLADIATIRRNSQHLAKLVNDVLDLSQVDAGRMALTKEWTCLPEVIEAAVEAVQALFHSKGLYLETEIEANLPPVFCDSTRIRQVVLNLLSNASRFTERGGVRVKAWLNQGDVILSTTDTGPGIAPEDQAKLFEPFQQLDGSVRRRYGGSGLGLSISKRFVEMHGGKMWLESQVGVGTTFYFSLPVTTPPPDLLDVQSARRWFSPYIPYEKRTRPFKAPASQPRPRFLLMEKGDALSRRVERFLDQAEITPVQDLKAAVEELNRSPARALIVNSATLDEEIAPHSLKELPYGTPAMVCWVPGEEDAARRLGVVRYLVKPVTREMLLEALETSAQDAQSVLLVDDEQEILRLFGRILSSAERPYRVLRAENGQRALSLLKQRKPDVMVLDLIMAGTDGFQVLRQKSQDPEIRDIPVIVVSSKDPTGEPIESDTLTVTCSGGFSMRNLLACIQAISEILSPSGQSAGPALPENPAA